MDVKRKESGRPQHRGGPLNWVVRGRRSSSQRQRPDTRRPCHHQRTRLGQRRSQWAGCQRATSTVPRRGQHTGEVAQAYLVCISGASHHRLWTARRGAQRCRWASTRSDDAGAVRVPAERAGPRLDAPLGAWPRARRAAVTSVGSTRRSAGRRGGRTGTGARAAADGKRGDGAPGVRRVSPLPIPGALR